jgi:hypothetical protein
MHLATGMTRYMGGWWCRMGGSVTYSRATVNSDSRTVREKEVERRRES